VPPGAIPAQIDFALTQLQWNPSGWNSSRRDKQLWWNSSRCDESVRAERTAPENPPRQIKLYNSGSFFDPAAIPLSDYATIANQLSFAANVIVESHPRLINEKSL